MKDSSQCGVVQAFLDIADVPADANATLRLPLDAKEESDHAEHGISGSFRFQDRRGQGVTAGSLRRRGDRGRVGRDRHPRRGDEDCEQSSCEASPVRHLKIKMALIAAFEEGADRILAAAPVKPQENVIVAVQDRHTPLRCH
jgi:hypothetical protein